MPDPKTVELTANGYRIPLALPAAGEAVLAVVEEQPVEETIKLFDTDDNRLGLLVSSGELDPKIRQVLAAIVDRRQAVARQRSELDRLNGQRTQLVDDEKRLRDNLAVLGGDPEAHKRLLDKFNETEAAIDTASAAITKSSDALAAAERDLASYLAGLTL
jgi:chromosome segregation ATPase